MYVCMNWADLLRKTLGHVAIDIAKNVTRFDDGNVLVSGLHGMGISNQEFGVQP